jgi:hypothetical protein
MFLIGNHLRASALATVPAPGLAATQPHDCTGPSVHHHHCDTDLTNVASTGSVEGERVFDLPLSNADHQRILYAAPSRPGTTIVMLPGEAGDVGVERDGDVRHGDNFVVRTRAQWTAKGYAVLIPNTIDRVNPRGVRSSQAYARPIDGLVRFAHAQTWGLVFLLGTSQGSIAGMVLTESVSRMGGSHETVFGADPRDATAPALAVANRDDACDIAPPEDAPRIAAAMSHSRDVHILPVADGITKSRKACGALTPHGYYGIEAPVIDQINQWMQAHA